MKLKDYRPYYKKFENAGEYWFNDKLYDIGTWSFWSNEDIEIDNEEVNFLNEVDFGNFISIIIDCKTEREILNILNNTLIMWRVKNNTCDYLPWIKYTIKGIEEYVKYDTGWALSIAENWLINKKKINSMSKNNKHKRSELTFEKLFKDSGNAKKVKDILELKEYTIKGKWVGQNNNKTELLAAYYSLREKHGIMRTGQTTPQTRLFYNEFGLNVPGYMSERALTTPPASQYIQEFNTLFNHVL